ncbi:nucleotide exchange factor GrpE [Halalkalicoccus ordinarius]|uniref:nucleotide exchange factor GrpE n=1 Tax=Halalkalicoccus ordinarius TaxID=3116651 RepID=UPI00300F32CA
MSNDEPGTVEEEVETERDAEEPADDRRPSEESDRIEADESGTADDRVETLETELEEREERIDELESRLKRTQADFQNYKKRAKKRQTQMEERATEELVERLLDVRDNLNRALQEESDDVEALREGVKMTLAEFDRVLDAENVREITPDEGSEVDPQRHEVMMRVESDRPEGAIDEVYTPGYEMGERVLRPAQVTVSDGSDGE